MNSNEMFKNTINEINQIGRGYGFRNGIHWAEKAVRLGEIQESQFYSFKHCTDMAVKMKGMYRDFTASSELVCKVQDFKKTISISKLRNAEKKPPKLPNGTFRAFQKQFHWKGIDGEPYDFRFVILNDGNSDNPNFRINIEEAPHFSETQNNPHRFHILGAGSSEPYICWDSQITEFEKANAVMIVWAQNYKKELDNDKKARGFTPVKKAAPSRKKYLPNGTFRNEVRTVFIEKSVYDSIMELLGTRKPEKGGMLGFSEEQDLITSFVFDKKAKVTSVEYNPDTKFLDTIINGNWAKKGISLAGFVHSHPGNFNQLSGADVEYATRICKEFDLEYLIMPIVTSCTDSETSITGYVVTIEGEVIDCNIEVMDSSVLENSNEFKDTSNNSTLEATKKEFEDQIHPSVDNNPLSQDETFARISTTIPLDYMKECTIIGIGCGGSRGFYEDMTRCGVGKFLLIDGDTSSRSNIASQNGYVSEIGKNKACVVSGRLSDINENLSVFAMSRMLDDSISDEDFEKLLDVIKYQPEKTLICAFSDSFEAQARAQKLAIKLNIPFLAAQHHANGDTSEIIYWYPGVSKYTQEDILKDRYEAYQNGFKNDVTSVGSPIFNTTRLNALCEKIAVGMLLYAADVQTRYTSFLKYNADRNLIFIRQKCLDFLDSPLDDLFDHGDRAHFDDVSWINPEEIL